MKLIVFGEILWDIFEDEKKIGGAPFNFGAHCAKLGMSVDVISAVGNDELGDMAISAVKNLKNRKENAAFLLRLWRFGRKALIFN